MVLHHRILKRFNMDKIVELLLAALFGLIGGSLLAVVYLYRIGGF